MTKLRETAYRLPLIEISNSEYFKGEKEFEANYIITKHGFRVSRVSIWGNVIKKYVNEEKTFGVLNIDDFTGNIAVHFFKENLELINEIKVGERINVIGKVKKAEDIFIAGEIIKKLSAEEELIERLDNIKGFLKLKKELKEKNSLKEKENKKQETELIEEQKIIVNEVNELEEFKTAKELKEEAENEKEKKETEEIQKIKNKLNDLI